MAEIQKMRISHEMILNWLVMNPEKTQGECAEVFGVTPAWLSTVINSDCFQVRWVERRMMLDKHVVSLAEAKLRGTVDKGLDRLEQLVQVSSDPRFVLDTTDKLLGRLGYGPKVAASTQVNVQNNTFMVSKSVLAAARGEIIDQGVRIVEEKVLQVEMQNEEPAAVPVRHAVSNKLVVPLGSAMGGCDNRQAGGETFRDGSPSEGESWGARAAGTEPAV